MKITGRTMMTSHLSIDETILKFKECGYEGLEFCFGDVKFNFLPNQTLEFFANHVLECCEKFDMPIESLSYHCDYVFDDVKYENLKQAISSAHLYKTKIFIISNAVRRWDKDQDEDWKTFIKRTKSLVKLAEEKDITIALEFEPGMVCGSTKDLHKMFKEIDSPNLKVNLDIGHVFLRDEDPMLSIESLKDKIVHVHIENMLRGVHRHLPPHFGDMNLQEYIDKLKEINFTGAMSFDLYGFDYIEESKKAVPFIKSLL